MRKIKKIGLSILLGLFTFTNVAFAAPQMPSDIKGHWAEKDITTAVNEGWAYMENGTFNPDNAATREEVVWMLIGKVNLVKPEGYDAGRKENLAKYNDEPSAWAKDRMAVAIGNGYITGYPDNTIGPKNPITRAELAVLLSRLIKGSAPAGQLPFTDSIPGWAQDGIKKAYGLKIITGYPDKTFKPNNSVTKAEALAMIARWAKSLEKIDIPELSTADEERLMTYDQYKEGSYYASNEQFKASYELKYIPDYLAAAEEHVKLRENYDYKKVATEAGKAEYKEAFMKYMRKNYTGSTAKCDKQIQYILDNKLVKEATFVTDDNCIYKNGSAYVVVRGIEYFTITSKAPSVLQDIKVGVQYKRDAEIFMECILTQSGYEYIVQYYGYLGEPVEIK